jgi:hypothetical protein
MAHQQNRRTNRSCKQVADKSSTQHPESETTEGSEHNVEVPGQATGEQQLAREEKSTSEAASDQVQAGQEMSEGEKSEKKNRAESDR